MRRYFFRDDDRFRAGWRLLFFLLAVPLVGLLGFAIRRVLALPRLRAPGADVVLPEGLLAAGVVSIGLLLGLLWLFFRVFERRPVATLGLPLRGPWLRGIGTGLLLGAVPVALLVAMLAVAGRAQISPSSLSWPLVFQSLLPITVGLALFSAQEELVLRGYVLQLLAEGAGRWVAALVTGIVFGLAHVGNPGANPLGLINTAAGGVLLAWLVMRTGSLWIACGYHAGWNLAGAVLFGMRLSGMAHPAALLKTELSGPNWVAGGSYGFEGSLLIGLLELFVLSLAVIMAPRLPGHPEMRPYLGAPEGRQPAAAPLEAEGREGASIKKSQE